MKAYLSVQEQWASRPRYLLRGLVVWFSLRVREAPGSTPGEALLSPLREISCIRKKFSFSKPIVQRIPVISGAQNICLQKQSPAEMKYCHSSEMEISGSLRMLFYATLPGMAGYLFISHSLYGAYTVRQSWSREIWRFDLLFLGRLPDIWPWRAARTKPCAAK